MESTSKQCRCPTRMWECVVPNCLSWFCKVSRAESCAQTLMIRELGCPRWGLGVFFGLLIILLPSCNFEDFYMEGAIEVLSSSIENFKADSWTAG